jgi:hypothetical protein
MTVVNIGVRTILYWLQYVKGRREVSGEKMKERRDAAETRGMGA